MSKRKALDQKVCCFCGLSDDNEIEFGKIHQHGDIVTHYYCLLLSSNMEQKGRDNEGILGFLASDIQKEIRRGKRLVCSYCKKNGATLGCCNTKCKRIFHYPCGLRAGSLNQFFGEFRSFCNNHRPKQKIDLKVKNQLETTTNIKCYICYEDVDPADITNTIWAPCCKKNTWFHRRCVQQLAMSAGYFFKCPLCNNKEKFEKAMLEFGIFIPRQDASWELEPNAFHELLFRHDQCDAPMCLCPKGRKYTSFNAKWELTLCRSCGSQGIHMACGQLKWAKPVWECSECISILDKSEETTNANTSVITLQSNDFNSENSDSDISVGKESPIPFMTNIPSPILMQDVPTIKLRPGPRTFKLRQQMQIAKEQEMQNRISKQQSTEEEDTTSKLPCAEECTSNKNTLKSRSDICEEYINSTTEHSESVTAALNDTIIMLDSDDDRTKNKTTSSLESTILIADVSETAATNLFELKSSAVEDEKSDTVHDFSLFQTLKLETSNLDENYKNNSSTDNFKSAENVDLEENKSIALDEIIHLNPASDYDSRDMLSNIKISNVMSLTPEEFENVSFIMAEREADCTECPSQICSPRPHSSMSKSDHFEEVRFKRKVDNDTLSSTNALEVNHKKMRRSLDILYEQEKQRRHVHISTKNSRKPVASVNSTLPSIEINKDNKDSTSGNVLKIHDSVTKTAATINQTSNADHSIEANTYETLDNDVGSTSSECKKQGNNNRTTMNQAETIFEDKMIKGHRRSCDADAGTSPAVTRSGYRDITRDSRIDPTRECVSHVSLQSGTSEQLERQSGLQMATISHCKTSVGGINQTSNERDHYRLIPEYIRLRDLKFRVCSSNNLQMILYNKFSVNINMENATAVRKTTKFDVSPRKSVQQKYLKTHTESPSVFMTESILCSSTPICKDKVRHSLPVIDRSENYRDDAKENLDPISCKNLADNSNNLSEESGSMHFPYNLSKAIEEDNKRLHRETVNSVTDIVNTFDADELIARSNDIQFKNISSVKQNVRRNGTAEYIKKDDPFDSKSICVNSIFENKKNATGSNFKISIDLKKIESFIHTNPELFSKSRKINDERSIDEVGFLKEWNDMSEISNIASRHVTDSVIDESMHLGNFTISLTGNRLTELKSHAEESKESDNEVVSTNNLVTETRYFNKPSFNRSKHDVKWTGSHFEKRCFFNR